MPVTDTRVDDYINNSAEFAKPILTTIRSIIHKACPEVKETIKWSFPNFEYAGGVICSMASFKQHCSFTFWRAALMKDPDGILAAVGEKTAMGHFGRITSVSDLPAEAVFIKYIKEAMALNEQGVKVPKAKAGPVKEYPLPPDFHEALTTSKAALTTFQNFSPSHRKEYIEWITEAKTEATRNKRIGAAIEMLEEGKSKNWKYAKS